jgi:hypothetical protein
MKQVYEGCVARKAYGIVDKLNTKLSYLVEVKGDRTKNQIGIIRNVKPLRGKNILIHTFSS